MGRLLDHRTLWWPAACVTAALLIVAYPATAYVADPLVVPVLLAGGAIGLLALARPAWGIALAMAALAAEAVSLPLPTGSVSAAEALLALVGAGWVLRMLLGRVAVRPTLADVALAALIATIAAGLFVAENPAPVLRVVVLWTAFALAYLQVRDFDAAQVRLVVVGLAIGTGVLGAIGAMQFLMSGDIQLFGGGQYTSSRAEGALDDPNYYASLLLLGSVPGLALALRDRAWWLLVPVGFGLAGIVFSLSRGGTLGLGAALLVMLLWRRARRVAVAVVVVVTALTLGGLNPLMQTDQFQVVTQRLSTVQTTQLTVSSRPRIWRTAAGIAVDNPLLGVGINNFRYEARRRGLFERGRALENAHSIPFSLAAETGLLGLTAFVLFAGAVLAGAVGTQRARSSPLRLGLAAALVGFLVQGLTVVQIRAQVVMGTFLVVAGLLAAAKRHDEDGPPEGRTA